MEHERLRHRGGAVVRHAEHGLARDPREQAVLRAEIKRLVHALSPYRVLRRDALEREARAGSWNDAGFDQALQAAVDQGKIEELPLGFYALPRSDGMNGGGGGDGESAA